ncbi:unnamed protein product [Effrenium voratum]|uniref:R3H domain-containing protein n=1 Tax=Effrenium voratum TaxID=2562239 RepID=A0AA36J9T4_9DINO|nr:unnamed protein product [Effrenium voratum]
MEETNEEAAPWWMEKGKGKGADNGKGMGIYGDEGKGKGKGKGKDKDKGMGIYGDEGKGKDNGKDQGKGMGKDIGKDKGKAKSPKQLTLERQQELSSRLDAFVSSEELQLRMPSSITTAERKYLHKQAAARGLKTQSFMPGTARVICIFKQEALGEGTANASEDDWDGRLFKLGSWDPCELQKSRRDQRRRDGEPGNRPTRCQTHSTGTGLRLPSRGWQLGL